MGQELMWLLLMHGIGDLVLESNQLAACNGIATSVGLCQFSFKLVWVCSCINGAGDLIWYLLLGGV